MKIKEYLDQVTYIGKSDITDDDGAVYYSKFDDSYITKVGMEDDGGTLKFLADHEITSELTHGVGFNPSESKWYGWSHRAMYGFEIGSTCKEGDCHYNASNKEDFIKNTMDFWSNEYHEKDWFEEGTHRHEFCEYEDSETEDMALVEKPGSKTYGDEMKGVWICRIYNDKVPNEALRGEESRQFTEFPKIWGRGEWVAKTMEDAKQMAKDFNKGVS